MKERKCVCDDVLHVGTIMESETDEEGRYRAVIEAAPVLPTGEMKGSLLMLCLTTGQFIQRPGDRLTWQYDVGVPVDCNRMD